MVTITSKPIDAIEMTVENLFSGNKIYIVPDYQRTYAWEQDQLEDLLRDVESISEDNQHFLGAIVVIPKAQNPKVDIYEIVDGQQRMATLLIWLAAIRDFFKDEGMEDKAEKIKNKLLFYEDWDGNLHPRVKLNKLDDGIFQKILKGNVNLISDRDNLVFKAYEFLKNSSKDKDPMKLMDKILKKISVVHIEVKNHLVAFKLFETLNDRGLELSAADLIKNYLLMKISEKNNDKIDEAVEKWNDMFENVRDLEPVKFIRRYMLSTYSGKISESRLYDFTVKLFEKSSLDDIMGFIDSLRKFSVIYRKIANAECENININNALKRLQMVEVVTSYTLLMRLFDLYYQGVLKDEHILKIIDLIEKFHIWWGITGLSTNKLDTIYNELSLKVIDMVNENKSGEEIVDLIKDKYKIEIKSYLPSPTKDFLERFRTRKFTAGSTRTKYILWQLNNPTGETSLNLSDIHTEHIMPKTLNKKWIEYLKNYTGIFDTQKLKEKHKEYINRIGNLTIIKGAWNISMSNRIFEDKKKDYERSEIGITKDLTKYEKWTFEEIEKRSEELAKIALSRWNLFEGGC